MTGLHGYTHTPTLTQEVAMEADERQALLDAVTLLIMSPEAHNLYESLEAASRVAERHPIALSGKAAPLNPLLSLRLRDKTAYENVIALVERRRETAGFDPLVAPKDSRHDKVAYMREFMQEKRERQRLAAAVENMLRPERDRLVGNDRLEFMRRQSVRWGELRDLALAKAREAAGGSLDKATRNKVIEEFWAAVDADLEAKLASARRAQLDPRRTRHPTEDMTELMEALNLPAR